MGLSEGVRVASGGPRGDVREAWGTARWVRGDCEGHPGRSVAPRGTSRSLQGPQGTGGWQRGWRGRGEAPPGSEGVKRWAAARGGGTVRVPWGTGDCLWGVEGLSLGGPRLVLR